MKFQLLPITDVMIELYQTPLNTDRFTNYMKILQGNIPGDISIPVTFFNPMGKEHVLNKLKQLRDLKAEQLIEETLMYINSTTAATSSKVINVALALADDLGGSWTNRYTTDYDSKFNMDDLMKRNFCNPLFWVSEEYSKEKIKERIADYCYRSFYRLTFAQPVTIEQHVEQEIFVAENNPFSIEIQPLTDFNKINHYYQHYKTMNSFPAVFNFMYGDAACKELGMSVYGIPDAWTGYKYAAYIAVNRKELQKATH
ncbi:MAG TPA: hypothetical protein VLB84_18710 [Bacteroidia bacterium]|jgi:hypothetical protein|nr:hypothetical protein [Bacteroidia bacterium]